MADFLLQKWNPNDPHYWEYIARRIALRNLWISIFCLFLGFTTWSLWPVTVLYLNQAGFNLTNKQLFMLVTISGLSGATLRLIYSFLPALIGGKNWTIISTALLLIPTYYTGWVVQHPETSYSILLVIAAACGLGGGCFSSSIANISHFFPDKLQGKYLGLNAGLGNVGISIVQLIAPWIISLAWLGNPAHSTLRNTANGHFWLQNIAYIWLPFIILATILACFGTNNLPTAQVSFKKQWAVLKSKHFYLMAFLYTMSYGSFIGYSVAFPLLTKIYFPNENVLHVAFLGPLLSALIRPLGGFLADRFNSGSCIILGSIILMILLSILITYYIAHAPMHYNSFILIFIVLFAIVGIASGAVPRLIAVIFPTHEKGTALGLIAGIAAYGAFIFPQAFNMAIEYSGAPNEAFYGFIIFYLICFIITQRYVDKETRDGC